MMEVFQFKTKSWFHSKQLFIEDPLLSTQEDPVYCHILTGAMATCLTHKVSARAYDQHLFQYLQRYKTKDSIIHVYNVTLLRIDMNYALIEVMCEKMCFQVDKIIQELSVQQQMYIINQTIKNTEILCKSHGYFKITNKMVGLSVKGEVRMWTNGNHADNKRQQELGSEQQQWQSIAQYLLGLQIQNKLINAFINNIATMNLRFRDYEAYHGNYIRLHQIQAKTKVNLSNINNHKKRHPTLERQISSFHPSLKSSNATADMSNIIKENSLSPRFSELSASSYLHKNSNALQKKRWKENLEANSIKVKQKVYRNESNTKYNLGNRAKLQESIFIQSEDDNKPNLSKIVELQLLGKMGKVCQSTVAQDLILQQFKPIYQ